MKSCTASQLAWTFAGCFLGAGFVSGQELWQFFGCFGVWALPALLLSVGILAALGIILLRLAQETGIEELDRIVIRRNIPWLRKLCAVLQVVFLFGIVTIMIAAAGALVAQLTGLPSWLGGLAMTVLVAVVAVFPKTYAVAWIQTASIGKARIAPRITGEGHGNPLQSSRLETPMGGGAR